MKNIFRKAGKGLAILLVGATLGAGGYFAGKYDGIQTGREQGRKAALYAVGKELKWLGRANLKIPDVYPDKKHDRSFWATRGNTFYLAGDIAPSLWRDALKYHLNHPDYNFPKELVDSRGRIDTNRVYQALAAEFDKMKLE